MKLFSQFSLERHSKICHNNLKEVHECLLCNKIFQGRATLESHMRTHENITEDFPCDDCSKIFKTKSMLQQHIMISHEEKKTVFL